MVIENITGIILAGGKSSRMGEDKGMMGFNGKPMISYIINTLSKLTDKILIVANRKDYEVFGLPVYSDLVLDKGPLAGIITGLSATTTDKNWMISCDSPFVSEDLLIRLMEDTETYDAAIPTYNSRIHPLTACYKKSALGLLKDELEKDHLKLRKAVEVLQVNYVNADLYDSENFKNFNSKEDL